jgi:hypothetical protein
MDNIWQPCHSLHFPISKKGVRRGHKIPSKHFETKRSDDKPGLPDFFFGTIYQKGKIYAKCPHHIPNFRKIQQMAIKIPNGKKYTDFLNFEASH